MQYSHSSYRMNTTTHVGIHGIGVSTTSCPLPSALLEVLGNCEEVRVLLWNLNRYSHGRLVSLSDLLTAPDRRHSSFVNNQIPGICRLLEPNLMRNQNAVTGSSWLGPTKRKSTWGPNSPELHETEGSVKDL